MVKNLRIGNMKKFIGRFVIPSSALTATAVLSIIWLGKGDKTEGMTRDFSEPVATFEQTLRSNEDKTLLDEIAFADSSITYRGINLIDSADMLLKSLSIIKCLDGIDLGIEDVENLRLSPEEIKEAVNTPMEQIEELVGKVTSTRDMESLYRLKSIGERAKYWADVNGYSICKEILHSSIVGKMGYLAKVPEDEYDKIELYESGDPKYPIASYAVRIKGKEFTLMSYHEAAEMYFKLCHGTYDKEHKYDFYERALKEAQKITAGEKTNEENKVK